MRTRSPRVSSLLFVLVGLVVAGRVQAAEPITLEAAVSMALQNSPVLKQSTEALNQYRYEKYALRSTLAPTVSLNGSASLRKDSVADKTVGSVPFGGSSYNLYNVGFRAEQPLIAYGLFAAGNQAKIQEQIGAEDVEITKRELTRDVIRAFYRTLMNEELVRLLSEQEKEVKEILSISRRRLGLGGKKTDYLQVQTRLALLKPKIESARNNLATSTAQLAHLLGLENVGELSIKGRLPTLAVATVTPRLDLKSADIPELNRIRLQRNKVSEQRVALLGKHLPQLRLVGNYDFLNYTKSDLFDPASESWSVQLVLNVPIFSGFSSISERRRLISQDARLEAQERDTANEVSLRQILSRKELETAEASLAAAQEAAKLARESLREARREYSVGLIDFLQYFQVQTSDFEASTSLLQLRLNAIEAHGNYFASSGQSLATLVELLGKEGALQ